MEENPMPRKPGAPSGNKNAYRHGFYSRQYKAAERRALDAATLADLAGEIEFVRVQLRRFIEAQAALPGPPRPETQIAILRATTLAAESINGMIRTQLVFGQALKDNEEFKSLWLRIPTEDP
jgi:hypothetical protein